MRFSASVLCALSLLIINSVDSVAADWLDEGWDHRIELRVRPEKLVAGATLNSVPLLLRFDGATLDSVFVASRSDGGDLVMTSSDGQSVLPLEVVAFDSLANHAELWFEADVLSETQAVFYLYYGNPDTVMVADPTSVWGPDHVAVYHFDDDPTLGVLSDATANGHDGVTGIESTFDSTDLVNTPLGRAWEFDGSTDWVYTESVASSDSNLTISAWYSNNDLVMGTAMAMQAETGFWDLSFRRTLEEPNGDLRTANGEIYWEPTVLDAALHHYVWVLDGDNNIARYFFDGIEQAIEIEWTPPGSSLPVYDSEMVEGRVGIAGPVWFVPSELTRGVVDEFRISEGLSSSERIETEYINQSDPIGYYDYVTENFNRPTGAPALGLVGGHIDVWPNPFAFAAQISVQMDASLRSVRVFDVSGRLVRTLRLPEFGGEATRLLWDGRDNLGANVSSGLYYVRATGDRGSIGAKIMVVR